MTKTFTIKLRGTKAELDRADIFLRMVKDLNKMGLNIDQAIKMVVTIGIEIPEIVK